MAELKPCKCGALVFLESEFDPYSPNATEWYIMCDECGVVLSGCTTKQQAIDAWNKRSWYERQTID